MASFSTTSLEIADRQSGGKYCTAAGDAPLGTIAFESSNPANEEVIKALNSRKLMYAHAHSACSTDSSVMALASRLGNNTLT